MKRTPLIALFLTAALTVTAAAATAVPSDAVLNGSPSGITLLAEGGYLLTDSFNKVIWQVDTNGTALRLAGQIGVAGLNGEPIGEYSDGALETAFFLSPWDIAPFLDGYVVSDSDANVIRYVDDTAVRTAAGSGKLGYRDAAGARAVFSRPTGLAAGDNGEVYIADTDNGKIRCLSPSGNVTTFFSGLSEPTGLCWWNGALYVAETGAHCISRIENGERTVLAGIEGQDGYTDGLVSAATLRDPQDVAVAGDGTVYIADTGNGAVRKLSQGSVSTLACSGEEGLVLPRSLLVLENTLFVTDPFARTVLEFSLSETRFEDIAPDTWYEQAVHRALALGLVEGIGDGVFAPEGTVTRAQMAQMFANLQTAMDHDMIPAGNAELTDTPEDSWYFDVARWAADLELLSTDGTLFHPDREITREEMAVALWKFAAAQGADLSARSDLSVFTDAALVSDGAREAVSWTCATGLIRGISPDQLAPNGTATRAQMAQVMIRFLALLQSGMSY